ncbi:MAG: helix-turn-helix domain-containing protein [Desulfobacteraceae bacterium]|nr:helix-turn-helix domain-containing protein [Desulfobacteraceae bacterium]
MTEITEKPFEVLTLEEFMERMKIGKTTVHKWKKEGQLKAGKHYIKNGKVVRFIWTQEVVLDLHDRNIMKVGPEKPAKKQKVPGRKRKIGVNLDY